MFPKKHSYLPLVALSLCIALVGCPPQAGNTVIVPDVVGQTQAAAGTTIVAAGLVLGTVTQQFSNSVPVGAVISQSPLVRTSATIGSAVNLVVSKGPATVAVPDVVDLAQADAETAITGAGLVVGTVAQQYSDTVAAGTVISQSPVATTTVLLGSDVHLVVSLGPAPVPVPNVVGQTQSIAELVIGLVGLAVGTVTQEASGTVAAGVVISQNPAVGTSAALGSAVDLVVSTGLAWGASATFMGLGDLAGGGFISAAFGCSSDGSVIVGRGTTALGPEAFRWNAVDGLVGLGDLAGGADDSRAYACSSDGSVIVGEGATAAGREAFRWNAVDGIVGLGDLTGGAAESWANAVSSDGSLIAGRGTSAAGSEAFRWTAIDGMTGLGGLTGGDGTSEAYGVSSDGSVIVGWSNRLGGTEAFQWTLAGGMTGLGDLPGGTGWSEARAPSTDASVIVGSSVSGPDGEEAFRWTSAGGMVGLGDLPGGNDRSLGRAVSADGARVVGTSETGSDFESNLRAFIWDVTNGMRNLADVLAAFGIDMTGWDLTDATWISSDGTTVVGYGQNPAGQQEAWVAQFLP